MHICFSCRLSLDNDALKMAVNSDTVCGRCYMKYEKEKALSDKPNMTFEEWRTDVAESYGFDPYLERDTDILVHARNSAALLPVSKETLSIMEDISECAPGLEADEILRQALGLLKTHVMELEHEAFTRSALAQMIGIHVAAALQAGSDLDEDF